MVGKFLSEFDKSLFCRTAAKAKMLVKFLAVLSEGDKKELSRFVIQPYRSRKAVASYVGCSRNYLLDNGLKLQQNSPISTHLEDTGL